MMFVFDIESLGVESNSAVLSVGMVYFNPDKKPSYEDLLNDSLFLKLNAKDQIDRLGRTVTKSTLDWWAKQHEFVRQCSFDPKSTDIKAEDAFDKIYEYMAKYPKSESATMWARGSLDQLAIDSLARKCDKPEITHFAFWRDVRTAVDCLVGTKNGYCNVEHPTFQSHNVIKHHPTHDCAYDAMMLMYGVL
jgi:hypothetical protein